jgi:hypothetical protein
MMLLAARLLAESTAALGHLTGIELALVATELTIDAAALAIIGTTFRRPRRDVEATSSLDEAA